METTTVKEISILVLAIPSSMTVQSFITIKWQEKKLSMIKIFKFFVSDHLKPGLHIVVTIAEHAFDVAPKMILRLSIHRFQIFLVKY